MFASFATTARRAAVSMYTRIWAVLAAAMFAVAMFFGWAAVAVVAVSVVAFAAAGWRVYRHDSAVEQDCSVRLAPKTAAKLFLAGLPVWAVHGVQEFCIAFADSVFGDARWTIPSQLTVAMLAAAEDTPTRESEMAIA